MNQMGYWKRSPLCLYTERCYIYDVNNSQARWPMRMSIKICNEKGTSIESMGKKFILSFADDMTDKFVFLNERKYPFFRMIRDKKLFRNFTCACYATEMFFQQCNRPSGNMQEGKFYFSGKHKLYGFKTEVSVLPNGLKIVFFSDHYPGSKSVIDIFYEYIHFHKQALQKREDGKSTANIEELHGVYEEQWPVIADKGYQGREQFVRLIHLRKKPPHCLLNAEEDIRNRNIS